MRNLMREWYEGHITVTIRGKRFERLVNLAVREGIHIWNISRSGSGQGQFDILIRDYYRLRPLLRETGCKSHVTSRGGFPFWLIRIRRRAGFAVGAFLFLFGMYMLSTFVWTIEVQGTVRLTPGQVEQVAEKVGIKQGAWKVKLKEPQILQKEMTALLPEASWIGVHIEGTKVTIQVVEKEVQEPAKQLGPRHLIAKKKAVIHRVEAEAGKSMVQVNQFVDKGQVLISGVIGNDTRQGLVAAKGKVEGEVWYVSNVSVPLNRKSSHLTGQKQDLFYLVVGSYAVQLWPLQTIPFEKYEASETRVQLGYSQYSLPVGWKKVSLYEQEDRSKSLTQEEAIALGKQFARQDILSKAGKEAVIKDEKVLHVKTENGKVYLSIHYAVIEDIALEQPIVALPPAPGQNTSDKAN
ncbi:sporulation protein YqfD [Brevibacillus migulae]|uniref:sporulation protein YqfD n=1 Tax=Brevibacillus migulae TaxID=1644114 RepID=UPI00106E56F9|nr:sporulation protein YqfD [Brevibacillus migulae]